MLLRVLGADLHGFRVDAGETRVNAFLWIRERFALCANAHISESRYGHPADTLWKFLADEHTSNFRREALDC